MTAKYTMDFTDFNKKFTEIVKHAVPDSAAKGVREALQQLKLDADNVPPRTPHKEGHLRGSGRVGKVSIKKKEISGSIRIGGKTVRFNVPYAARWHEVEPGTINWSEPDVGPKYLESKMIMFKEDYMKIIAEVIRRRAR